MDAADSGAEDIEDLEEEVVIYTNPSDLSKVRQGLLQKGYSITDAGIIRQATTTVHLDEDEAVQKALAFIEKFEEMDDVQKVYTNVA